MLSFDFKEFERVAARFADAERQLPFILANTLTTAAFKTKEALVGETWPGHVTVRNRTFIKAALQIKKARKSDLEIGIFDNIGNASLRQHAEGGVRRAKRNLAIPPQGSVQRTARGAVVKSQTPRAIIANTPKRALRVTSKGIFVGQGGRLRLKYVFKPSAQIRKDVPFREDFERVMRREVAKAFVPSLLRALSKPRR